MSKIYSPEELNSFSKETLVAVILSMQDQLSRMNTNMERLIEQIADANNKRYGRSSEKLDVIAGQLELELIFNEAEALTETLYVVEPAEEDVIQVRRRKKKGKREEDLKDLPVEVIPHTLSDEKLQELFGKDGWKQLPDEVYKRVRVQPAVYTVEEHHVAVYAGRDNQTIVKADRPKDLLRNSILTPSLAASIMNAKYVNGLPLYRISQEFLRNDIHISKQVMANWMIQCADRHLGILYDRFHKELYRFHVLQADETPVKVSKDGRPANSKSYMWIYRTGKNYKDTPIVLYEYQRTRKADHPREFLKGFTGVVVCDGYSAYRKLGRENPDIILLDLGLPDMDGVEIIRKIRTWSNVPIIVISARSEDSDKIEALDAGADDYLTKPFSVEELLARLRVTQRRLAMLKLDSAAENVFVNGDLRVDYAAGCAYLKEEELHLTPIEYKLLCLLAQNVGKVLTHTYITQKIWGNSWENNIASLRVFMATLRRKLEATPGSPQYIQTHIGVGYRMLKVG